ncbi:hypothetical protein OH77DRAFT_1166143 [Trametes cingulata]|nr:hypothetical protein OH77DRAFT_1166143 [Trametes cingulata]
MLGLQEWTSVFHFPPSAAACASSPPSTSTSLCSRPLTPRYALRLRLAIARCQQRRDAAADSIIALHQGCSPVRPACPSSPYSLALSIAAVLGRLTRFAPAPPHLSPVIPPSRAWHIDTPMLSSPQRAAGA